MELLICVSMVWGYKEIFPPSRTILNIFAAETKKYLSPSIILNVIVSKNSREKQFRLGDQYKITTVEHNTSGREINFFLTATWLLNSSKW